MLTREQFQTIDDQGADVVFLVLTAMHQQIDFLTARVKELEERLDKDSHNSHKPPSTLWTYHRRKPESPHLGGQNPARNGHETNGKAGGYHFIGGCSVRQSPSRWNRTRHVDQLCPHAFADTTQYRNAALYGGTGASTRTRYRT